MTGGLDLRHKAMAGLFDRESLIAHVLGRDRIYSVRFGNLRLKACRAKVCSGFAATTCEN